ncbi:hypothetical protein DCAR_0101936 [Daucus carota subsp. sativus]|uniref:Agenet domain-containing protein n=1 Tax=Daucus carota subsp. sativus TaxID=79200 RepID=A0AAF1AHD1_DAUCS|nr:hypothetical protein DCAR_0101936 [Daucus carota subsp. sativus]
MVYHNFKPGSRVEVRSDDEGFKGACYLATVLENLENNKYLVAYDDLMESEDKDSNRLTETVHAQDLRPLPPVDRDEMIKIHDVVDAYHQDGWWTGQVIEILEEGKLVVYFQNPPDELIVHRNHLRLHLDWVDGRWEKPNKQVCVNFFLKLLTFGTFIGGPRAPDLPGVGSSRMVRGIYY